MKNTIRTLMQITHLSNMAARFTEDDSSKKPKHTSLIRQIFAGVVILAVLLFVAYLTGWIKHFSKNKTWIGIAAILILYTIIVSRHNKQ